MPTSPDDRSGYDLGRFELKFLIPADTRQRVLEAARPALRQDLHGEGGRYRVVSQYYDTLDLRSYWEKVDGVDPRRKFRLRSYVRDPELARAGPFFLELKHRADQTIYKQRLQVDAQAAWEMLETNAPLEGLEKKAIGGGRDRSTLQAFCLFAARDLLLPSNIISYVREAWIGAVDRRLRLTFDCGCCAHPPGDFLSALGALGVPIVPPTHLVMEVKFTRVLPIWLRDILVAEQLRPIRLSKYAQGVAALGDKGLRRFYSGLEALSL